MRHGKDRGIARQGLVGLAWIMVWLSQVRLGPAWQGTWLGKVWVARYGKELSRVWFGPARFGTARIKAKHGAAR